METSFVIDTDTASDDAVALLMAARSPNARIRGVTVVAGNVGIEQAVRNAKVTLQVAGAPDIPVWQGCSRPLLRPLETAQNVHGHDGMSGVPFPEPTMPTSEGHAVLALLEIAQREEGQHALVTLGPLTNIAAALAIDPLFLTRFTHTFMMLGTSDGQGNVSPIAEFNAWADPEATAMVVQAEGPKTLIGWDISRKYAVIEPDEDERLRQRGELGAFVSDINQAVHKFCVETTGLRGYDLPDPVAMAVALDPEIVVEADAVHLHVATDGITRGHTYADRRIPAKTANARVVTQVDESRFLEMLHAAVTMTPSND